MLLQHHIFACQFQKTFIHFIGMIYKPPKPVLLMLSQFQQQLKKVSFCMQKFLIAGPILPIC